MHQNLIYLEKEKNRFLVTDLTLSLSLRLKRHLRKVLGRPTTSGPHLGTARGGL